MDSERSGLWRRWTRCVVASGGDGRGARWPPAAMDAVRGGLRRRWTRCAVGSGGDGLVLLWHCSFPHSLNMFLGIISQTNLQPSNPSLKIYLWESKPKGDPGKHLRSVRLEFRNSWCTSRLGHWHCSDTHEDVHFPDDGLLSLRRIGMSVRGEPCSCAPGDLGWHGGGRVEGAVPDPVPQVLWKVGSLPY
ncbi:unnamed protein product [Rangifer tarandus platyrhynchus]|uniref:Uncharacterized protein n=2 Tax=Rangifer tarandus platyrhynchus TaxID=3082113 RepID=A0ACB0EVU0_RANTA|nr:unnamed protein product [Rangifer tarandus platyrhynchus]CAI9704810.1 unnamed protein product [Rangifer tarandus platyrhynchus]